MNQAEQFEMLVDGEDAQMRLWMAEAELAALPDHKYRPFVDMLPYGAAVASFWIGAISAVLTAAYANDRDWSSFKISGTVLLCCVVIGGFSAWTFSRGVERWAQLQDLREVACRAINEAEYEITTKESA